MSFFFNFNLFLFFYSSMPYVSVIRVSENCMNIYHSWFKVTNSNTLNKLSNTLSYSLVQLTKKKNCA